MFEDADLLPACLQQGGVAHMQGMMPHQGLGQQMVHPTPGGGAQMQGQWRQPLGGEETPPPRSGGAEFSTSVVKGRKENTHSSHKRFTSEMLWMSSCS